MKIVLDTNSLIAIIPSKATHRWAFEAIRNGQLSLAVTTEILAEYAEKLADFYFPELAENTIAFLLKLPKTELIANFYRWNTIAADPDDNKFVDCAVAANAAFLVSYDRHYRVLKKRVFPKVAVIDLDELKIQLGF